MLACLPDGEIERFIDEDLPYGDLTTHLLGIGHQRYYHPYLANITKETR